MNHARVKKIKSGDRSSGAVVYWMQRDQRMQDNWSLIYAQQKAEENKVPLTVVFCLVQEFLGATIRQYDFMLKGLEEVESDLKKFNIPFTILTGDPGSQIPAFVKRNKAGTVISDFNPLRITRVWKKKVIDSISCDFYTVDSHNIVPAWVVSDKEEFAAYTIRPKIHKALPEYLDSFPKLKKMPGSNLTETKNDWKKVRDTLNIDFSVEAIDWLKPGEKAAGDMLKNFLTEKLELYNSDRNDPTKEATSNLSPYLHFGQISAQRIALDSQVFIEQGDSLNSFLEELIVRRELADNYCFYNKNYDLFDGIRDWAKTTLNDHRKDKREYVYSGDVFEGADTHDDLWNAAQLQMMKTGKMHGYMRMYWAKKILEWTKTPEEAFETAIYLNDKYELDGRDPNGYTGVAWSVGGIHDRAWAERPVFGKIRFMNYNGCKRKFDVKQYIDTWINPSLKL